MCGCWSGRSGLGFVGEVGRWWFEGTTCNWMQEAVARIRVALTGSRVEDSSRGIRHQLRHCTAAAVSSIRQVIHRGLHRSRCKVRMRGQEVELVCGVVG